MRRFITAASLIALLAAPSVATPVQDATAPAAAPADPAAAKEAAKAAKAAAKAEARRMAQLRAQYGEGPYPDQIAAYADARPEPLRPLYRTLYTGGERNAVLNFQRLGLAAFQGGFYKDAAWAFDQALGRIETIYANNPQAATARSVFHNESNKDYKGEPYERAMAYYYRGLLYLRDGDYQNARISFDNAERMDTLSDAEEFQSDFAAMNYLQGWSRRCEGRNDGKAREYFELAAKAQKGLTAPAEGDNILFIAELGNGPIKARDGAQAQKLLFQAGEAYPETLATVTHGRAGTQSALPLVEASSVTYQATTRGGRAIDGLMNGKANWKEGTDGVGTALMTQGMMGGDGGGYMAMAGLALSLFSSAMKTNADIRAWDGLPDRIMIGTAKAASPDWTYNVTYAGEKGPVELKGMTMRADAKGCGIVWVRSRPAVYGEGVVGEDAGVAASQARKKPVILKNKAFRTALEGQQL